MTQKPANEHLKKRSEEIDLEVALNQEFDRIWDLIIKSDYKKLADDVIFELGLPDRYEIINLNKFTDLKFIFHKREILATIFLAKNEDGYILEEGNLPNPDKMTIEEKNSSSILVQEDDLFWGINSAKPESLRELFTKNCFAETMEEIKNLRLITW